METVKKETNLFFNKNLQIIYLITLMAVLSVISITPALPMIAREFKISSNHVGLLIIATTLPGVFLTPLLGVLADRYGRKKVLAPSLLLFAISGFACFFANSFELLVLLRFLQGVGSACLGSLNVTLIGDLFKGKERMRAMGYNASVLSIATASYPFIGGLLASIDWRFVFLLPLLAVPIALAVIYKLDNPEPQKVQTLKEYLSSAFSSIKNRNALILFSLSVITFIILYGTYVTYFPVFLDEMFAAKPFIIGLIMSAMSLVTAIVSSQLGKITEKFGEKTALILSFVMYALALSLIPTAGSIYVLLIPVLIYGFGHGINIPSIQTMLSNIAPLEYRAAFMSMNGMVLRVGQTLGPVIMGLVFSISSITSVFIAGAVFAVAGVVLLFFMKVPAKD
ncbi:MAG: MFS transporter [Ignavibacteriales bacterium]|nr:MAG: MFS transporter [Ignavibacteriales bacterium]